MTVMQQQMTDSTSSSTEQTYKAELSAECSKKKSAFIEHSADPFEITVSSEMLPVQKMQEFLGFRTVDCMHEFEKRAQLTQMYEQSTLTGPFFWEKPGNDSCLDDITLPDWSQAMLKRKKEASDLEQMAESSSQSRLFLKAKRVKKSDAEDMEL